MPRKPNPPEVTLANIMAKTERAKDGCLLWTGLVDRSGYPRTTYRKKPVTVHELVWYLTYGDWSTREQPVDHVCHNEALQARTCLGGPTCAHRRCVEVSHLRRTTKAENTDAGMIGQRRYLRVACENCGSELTDDDRDHEASRRMGFCRSCRRTYDRQRAAKYRKAKADA